MLVYILGIGRNIDAQLLNHALGYGAIRSGTLDRKRAAETQAEGIVYAELVALGVSAKVVVVVEDEDTSLAAGRLAVKMRGRETADAAADDDQVIDFAGVFRLARGFPEHAVAQAVSRVKRTRMAAPHSG